MFLRKMKHKGEERDGVLHLSYFLDEAPLDTLIGTKVTFEFSGKIQCVSCGRQVKKTFGDGYCFPCSQKLAACDLCILKPELCHYRHGTCREPDWGKENCLIPHVVYLANTTGLKVGITREHKKFERWGDQGATEAIVLARVPERYIAGLMEVALAETLADKSDWRGLIKGVKVEVDLASEKQRVISSVKGDLAAHLVSGPEFDRLYRFSYPVLSYPEKAITVGFDKAPKIEGTLHGIRGQYLFIDGKALNIRKHSGYEVQLS